MARSEEKRLVVYAAPQVVFNFLCSSLPTNGFTIQYVDQNNWTIHLKCGVSFTSWGENVVAQLFTNPDGSTLLRLYSESSVSMTLVDWGKNNQNLNKISQYVSGNFACQLVY